MDPEAASAELFYLTPKETVATLREMHPTARRVSAGFFDGGGRPGPGGPPAGGDRRRAAGPAGPGPGGGPAAGGRRRGGAGHGPGTAAAEGGEAAGAARPVPGAAPGGHVSGARRAGLLLVRAGAPVEAVPGPGGPHSHPPRGGRHAQLRGGWHQRSVEGGGPLPRGRTGPATHVRQHVSPDAAFLTPLTLLMPLTLLIPLMT